MLRSHVTMSVGSAIGKLLSKGDGDLLGQLNADHHQHECGSEEHDGDGNIHKEAQHTLFGKKAEGLGDCLGFLFLGSHVYFFSECLINSISCFRRSSSTT